MNQTPVLNDRGLDARAPNPYSIQSTRTADLNPGNQILSDHKSPNRNQAQTQREEAKPPNEGTPGSFEMKTNALSKIFEE